MRTSSTSAIGAAFVALTVGAFLPVRDAHAEGNTPQDFVAPVVFQAAGTVDSIQGTVDAYRAALGQAHREINWDGGSTSNQNTTISGSPFAGFQVTRGALFTTPNGTGFVQAPPAADPALFPPGGLAGVFNNATYGTVFQAFSLRRLFSAIDSNVTDVDFFVPGGGGIAATVSGFGAVFTDVDQPDGSGPGEKRGNRDASTLIECFGTDGGLLFSSFVPASPGDGSVSFLGIAFDDARIARVRITSGNVAPGPDDGGNNDIVMMDDFIYGEPHAVP